MAEHTLGRYQILDILGRGSVGVVYRARDPLLDREVALKTFVLDMATSKEQERFLREARAAGRLKHPNIVAVHDVGVDRGTHFIAMELVEGCDLRVRLQLEPVLPCGVACRIASSLADGLDHAHQRRIVHRDIKPANVLLNAEGEPKITDFGIARIEKSNLTTAGHILGTPYYMAPEQILGEEPDQRTDLFSLGVVLYQMLTGELPFPGSNVVEVANRIVHDPHPSARQHIPDLPDSVLEVLDRALAKDRSARYDHAAEMAHALDVLAADVAGLPAPAKSRARSRRRRTESWLQRASTLKLAASTGRFAWSAVRVLRLRPVAFLGLSLATVALVLASSSDPARQRRTGGSTDPYAIGNPHLVAAEIDPTAPLVLADWPPSEAAPEWDQLDWPELVERRAPRAVTPTAAPAALPPGALTLGIDFYSEFSDGRLSVADAEAEVFGEVFEFRKPRRLFGLETPFNKRVPGALHGATALPEGERDLVIRVLREEKSGWAASVPIEHSKMTPEKTLFIRLTRESGLTAWLDESTPAVESAAATPSG